MKKAHIAVFTILSIAACTILTLSQSGGTFVMQKSSVLPSGGQSSGGTFTLHGTAGEAVHSTSSGGTFQVGAGFWGGGTVAVINVMISGRVLTPTGAGLRNAVVTITNPQGVSQRVTTSSFGFYGFSELPSGGTYTISVSSKRYRFASQIVQPSGDLTSVNFTGLE